MRTRTRECAHGGHVAGASLEGGGELTGSEQSTEGTDGCGRPEINAPQPSQTIRLTDTEKKDDDSRIRGRQ